MCGPDAPLPEGPPLPAPSGPSRRRLLLAGAAAPLLLHLGWARPATAALDGVDVRPRSTWGDDLLPTGPLSEEAPGDVRFLLVHHTATPNSYAEADVPRLLRSIYGAHTGTKLWPDIAYNFMVDRFGRVWEARTGSLNGPVKGDTTGGSQGFALLCCFLGDHSSVAPSAAAHSAMGSLLAALAGRYRIDLTPGATTTFTSRGSNRHPVGTLVTAQTIAGHRDMSLTTCPGDACYPLSFASAPAEPIWVTPTGQATYVPVTPARLMDSRAGGPTIDGISSGGGALGPSGVRAVRVTGRGGVPASGVGAVVLNVTATGPMTAGFLTVFPAGAGRPATSNLNFRQGQTIPNLVVAKVGTDGQVSIHNESGFTHVLVDVTGWFPTGSAYNAVTPARLMDTRSGSTTIDGISAGGGPVGPGAIKALKVSGRGGVPASGIGAAVLNVTATDPTTGGFVTAHPADQARPLASTVNFAAGQTIPNLVICKVSPGGEISFYNDSGSTHLIADLSGWFPAGTDYNALLPARLLDTRPGLTTVDGLSAGDGPLGFGATRKLTVTGRGGLPGSGIGAVVLNLTVTGATSGSFLTVHPTGEARPHASNLNFGPGETIANLVIAKVGTGGQVSIYNDTGSTHLIADVAGWFRTPPT